MAALLPILLALALLASGLLYLTSGTAWPGLGWSLLLAPILHRAGSRLRPPGDPEVRGAVALPALGQAQEAWDLYARVWRPGKPHPQTWEAIYAQALAAVQ